MRCLHFNVFKAFKKKSQAVFQKNNSENGWCVQCKHSRTEVVISLISVRGANRLMFVYLQQPRVTFENNQIVGFCQLVTHSTPTPPPTSTHLKQEPFKLAKHRPFLSITPNPSLRSKFLVPTCIRPSGHWGGTSSPPLGRLHCLPPSALCGHLSCPGAILKMSLWKDAVSVCDQQPPK